VVRSRGKSDGGFLGAIIFGLHGVGGILYGRPHRRAPYRKGLRLMRDLIAPLVLGCAAGLVLSAVAYSLGILLRGICS
jgi:hypothetical protein